jgi:hypothetical protein
MAIQTTPHTQSHQNLSAAEPDLEPGQLPQEAGHGEDAELYANSAGAQTGAPRSFHANNTRSNLPKSLAQAGRPASRS